LHVQPETFPATEERTKVTKRNVVSAWGVATNVSAEESDDKDDNEYVNYDESDDDKRTMNTSQQSPAAKKQKRFASRLKS
jgi:LysM repeat protein